MDDGRRALQLIRYVAARVVAVAGIAVLVSFLTFFTLRMFRDPVIVVGAQRGVQVTEPEVQSELARELGTDRTLIAQYGSWLADAVRGDLGTSWADPDVDVAATLRDALPINLELVVLAQLFALALALPVGTFAGASAGGRFDRWTTAASTAFVSVPGFVLAIFLITLLSVRLGWFPVTAAGYVGFFDDPLENLRLMALPAVSLGVPLAGVYARVLRSDTAETAQEDFVTMAVSKGLPRSVVLRRHLFRPSALSLVALIGLQSGALLGGSILVEQLFAFPRGLGTTLSTAAISVDIPLVLGVSTLVAVVFALIAVVMDSVLRLIDPRIRRG